MFIVSKLTSHSCTLYNVCVSLCMSVYMSDDRLAITTAGKYWQFNMLIAV